MPSINKLLDKINQASSAVKSIKGIKTKIENIGTSAENSSKTTRAH